jgi:hypothetical protein
VERVDLVIAEADFPTGTRISSDERLEGVGQHFPGEPGHLDDLRLRCDRRV